MIIKKSTKYSFILQKYIDEIEEEDNKSILLLFILHSLLQLIVLFHVESSSLLWSCLKNLLAYSHKRNRFHNLSKTSKATTITTVSSMAQQK